MQPKASLRRRGGSSSDEEEDDEDESSAAEGANDRAAADDDTDDDDEDPEVIAREKAMMAKLKSQGRNSIEKSSFRAVLGPVFRPKLVQASICFQVHSVPLITSSVFFGYTVFWPGPKWAFC